MNAKEHDILFYDGTCGLCHRSVLFALRHDRAGTLCFAPLSGETYAARFSIDERAGFPDSVVLLKSDGRVLLRSDAILDILFHSGAGWKVVARMIGLFPRYIRDLAYDFIGRYRRHFFAAPSGVCPVVQPELSTRFLS